MTLKGLGTNASIYKTPDDSQSSNDTDSTCTEVGELFTLSSPDAQLHADNQ